jgi:L-alanine-DL-glutamate epimerase-like enolase superfamily enzyme
MRRFVYTLPLLTLAAFASAGCASSTSSGTDAAATNASQSTKNLLGQGVEVTEVTPLIYSIRVTMSRSNSEADARDEALLKAADLALAKGYQRFEIVGGDGFRRVSRKVPAGPVPVPLYSEPEGSLQVRLLAGDAPTNASTFDAAAEKARILQMRSAAK